MTVEEIFTKLLTHMLTGVMVHEGFANYFAFLGLEGYHRCHEYHHYEETHSYRETYTYYIEHYNQLITLDWIENPDVVPSYWYGHTRQEVDTNTKKESVKSGIANWVAWEQETKKTYQSLYNELISLGEVAAASCVMELVEDVDEELKEAENLQLNLAAVNYDMTVIIPEQEKIYKKKYKEEGRLPQKGDKK